MNRSVLFPALAATLLLGAFAACGGDGYASSAPYEAAGAGGPTGGTTAPMLVVVDANRTINAPAGEGAGVFVEYTEGGHWTVSWTCDTSISHLGCQFDLNVEARGGTISNILPDGLSRTDSFTSGPTRWSAQSTSTTATSSVTFDTQPGATIRVYQMLGGTADPSYFGFVQNGAPNGNYAGPLTDPLDFVPNTP